MTQGTCRTRGPQARDRMRHEHPLRGATRSAHRGGDGVPGGATTGPGERHPGGRRPGCVGPTRNPVGRRNGGDAVGPRRAGRGGRGGSARAELTRPDMRVAARDLETALRAALEQYRLATDHPAAGAAVAQAAAAARTTCAHLAAGDLVDAYLALRTAHDMLHQPTD